MIFRLSFWLSLILSITNSAFGLSSPYFNGFYAGLGAGAIQNQMKLTRQVNIQFFQIILTEQYNSSSLGYIYREAPFGEMHLGYGHDLFQSPLYLGAELFGNLASREIQTQPGNTLIEGLGEASTGDINQQTITRIRLNDFEYGIDLRPGLLLAPTTLLYGRIGAAFNKLKLNTNGSFMLTDPTTNTEADTVLNVASSKNVVGLRLGLGLAQNLNAHWALTTDYIYTNYGRISTNGLVNTNNLNGTVIPNGYKSHINARVNTQTVILGTNYYFDPGQEKFNIELPVPRDYYFSSFNGSFAGIKGGEVQTQAGRTIDYNATFVISGLPPPHSLGLSKSANHWDSSGIGEIFIGYGHTLGTSPFYLGGEIFGDLASHDIVTNNQNTITFSVDALSTKDILSTHTDLHLNSLEGGGDVKTGLLLTQNTLLYGRAGIAVNQLKLHSDNTFIFENNFAPPPLPPVLQSFLGITRNKTVAGLRFGLGVEEMLNNHWSANFDYIYTNYGKINLSGSTDVLSVGGAGGDDNVVVSTPHGLTSQVTASVTSEEELLGLTYHFG